MKYLSLALLGLIATTLCGCKNGNEGDSVVSQRYIHKYGYAISEEDWAARNYPGQQVTTLRSGVTVIATYENGMQHGPTTYTYPHSQTVEKYCLYDLGNKVKEITYDTTGIPVREWVNLSPTRYCVTQWYEEGSPLCVEEFIGEELLDGQYFSADNRLESRVAKGEGTRTTRDRAGVLLAKETVESGYAVKKDTFYPNGTPESIAYYLRGVLQGERRTYALTGEPLAIEEWINDQLHGKSTHFKHGNRYLETSYLWGQKNGIEKHYVDGDLISQEIPWENGLRHGEAVYYSEGKIDTEWYYADEKVSRHKFGELNKLDEIISRLPYSADGKETSTR